MNESPLPQQATTLVAENKASALAAQATSSEKALRHNIRTRENALAASAVVALMMLAAALSYVQSARVVPLIDWTWCTENAYRIAQGERPYVDFGLVTTPGTYAIQGGLMRAFGVSVEAQRIYATCAAAFTVLLTYRFLIWLTGSRWKALLLCTPLPCTTYVLYPFPHYDNDAGIAILILAIALAAAHRREWNSRSLAVVGLLSWLPCCFKQNIGLATAAGVALMLITGRRLCLSGLTVQRLRCFALGACIFPVTWHGWLYAQGGLQAMRSFWQWTFEVPLYGKPGMIPRMALAFFPSGWATTAVCWTLAVLVARRGKNSFASAIWIAMLVLAPAAWAARAGDAREWIEVVWSGTWSVVLISYPAVILCGWRRLEDEDRTACLTGIVPWFAILGTFASQGILNSNHGIWPLWLWLAWATIRTIGPFGLPADRQTLLAIPMMLLLSVTLGSALYVNQRLDYIPQQGEMQSATLRPLRGLSAPGPWLPRFESLVAVTDEIIPREDLVLTMPGEDPFHSVTGRLHPLLLFQMNSVTFPMPPSWAVEQAVAKRVKWIIVKHELQMPDGFMSLAKIQPILSKHFQKVTTIPGYTILRSRPRE